MSRKRRCEICGATASVTMVAIGERAIALCRADGRRARQVGAETLEALRQLFVEADGRRALLPRRARDERRVFPPRPEGRRHSDRRCNANTSAGDASASGTSAGDTA